MASPMDMADWVSLVFRFMQVVVLPALLWLVREILANRREIERMRGQIERHEERLECAPDDKVLNNLALQIEQLRGDVRVVGEKVGGLESVVAKLDRILDRQENYLLNGGSSK